MQRQDIPHNTPEQVRGYLRDALELVEELQPPDDLRPAVFAQAARLLAGKEVVLVQPQPVDLASLGLRTGPKL